MSLYALRFHSRPFGTSPVRLLVEEEEDEEPTLVDRPEGLGVAAFLNSVVAELEAANEEDAIRCG